MNEQSKEVKTLEQLLKERGMTQGEFSERIGRSRVTVSRWVNGHREMSLSEAAVVAAVLKVSMKAVCGAVAIPIEGIPDDLPAPEPDPWQN
jgi:transcriptional regulator with XRE-family HTH domain